MLVEWTLTKLKSYYTSNNYFSKIGCIILESSYHPDGLIFPIRCWCCKKGGEATRAETDSRLVEWVYRQQLNTSASSYGYYKDGSVQRYFRLVIRLDSGRNWRHVAYPYIQFMVHTMLFMSIKDSHMTASSHFWGILCGVVRLSVSSSTKSVSMLRCSLCNNLKCINPCVQHKEDEWTCSWSFVLRSCSPLKTKLWTIYKRI